MEYTVEGHLTTKAVVIELNHDIRNPKPDRRSKDWHCWPMVKAGMRFIVTGHSLLSSDQQFAWLGLHESLAKAIIADSTVVEPETVRELSVVYGCDFGGSEILRILLKLGRIDAEDFKAVAEIAMADENF